MKFRNNNEGGVSLIEVTFAVAIISIGVIVLMSQLESSYRTTCLNRETNKAMAHLEASLEKVVNTTFSLITTDYPDDGVVNLDSIDSESLLADEQITVHYADPDADPLHITVTIQWTTFRGGQRTRSLSTLATR